MSRPLILDITPLKNGYYHDSGRSGIFFTLKNILSELLKQKDRLDLYFNITSDAADDYYKAVCVLKIEFARDCDFILSRCFRNPGRFDGISELIFSITEKSRNRLDGRCIRKALRLLGGGAARRRQWSVSADVAGKAVFLSLMYAIPEHVKRYIPPERRCTMLYDTIPSLFPEYSSQMQSWYGKLVSSLSSDEKYLSISQATSRDFKRLFPVLAGNDTGVVPLAAADSFRKITEDAALRKVKEKYSIPSDKKVFFSHCSLAPHKNLERLFAAFCQIREQLPDWMIVFSGSNAPGAMNKLLAFAGEQQIPESSFCFTGYVDDEDLPALYSLADIFCFVSLYEGFGLPVLEAMSCGTACIVSNTSSIPEVAGDAALYVDPEDTEDIAVKMLKAAENEALRADLESKSLERAKIFSWNKCCRMIIENLDLI